jgi:hypothetical protein
MCVNPYSCPRCSEAIEIFHDGKTYHDAVKCLIYVCGKRCGFSWVAKPDRGTK